MKQIYLDYNASTPIADEVADAIRPYLNNHYGNPSSHHWAGAPAKQAVEHARSQVASLLGCEAQEIIFTSGGTESNNHALKGAFFALRHKGNHIITTQVEHPAIIEPCRFLETLGAEVTYLPVDSYGMVDPDDVAKAITPRTILISMIHANNEVGTIQPIADVSRIAAAHNVLMHSDAAQSLGKIPVKVKELGIDLLSLAGHKLYAPKGVGALYIRNGITIEPYMHGAGHESGRRAGTENVLLDVGLGAACELAEQWIDSRQIVELRDYFWTELQRNFAENVALNGHPVKRLPNTLNVSFIGRSGSEILSRLEGVAASTGSACHSGDIELSPTLKAMGTPAAVGAGAIRFSLGRSTTRAEIDAVLQKLAAVI